MVVRLIIQHLKALVKIEGTTNKRLCIYNKKHYGTDKKEGKNAREMEIYIRFKVHEAVVYTLYTYRNPAGNLFEAMQGCFYVRTHLRTYLPAFSLKSYYGYELEAAKFC